MSDPANNSFDGFPPALPPVLILAGGQGTRLRSVVADRPKVLASVAGRPFLSWWFSALGGQGFRQVVLCTGHLAGQIQETFGNAWGPMQLSYSQETSPLGTGGAIGRAARECDGDWVLVLNGDSFCELDFWQMWQHHLRSRAAATMAVVEVSDTRRYGRVEFEPDGQVLAFREKESTGGLGWINAGAYLLPRAEVAAGAMETPRSLERDILPAWVGRGLFAETRTGRFIDIGTPESYLEAQTFFGKVGTEI